VSALDRVNHMPVKAVAGIPGPAAEELFRLAMGERLEWTIPDWRAVLVELDACNEPVREWRVLRE
jgi:hypothetical protein